MNPEDHAVLQPLNFYLSDLDAALTARLEYPALALALALPDICSTLEKEGGKANKDLYANWCNRWVTTPDCHRRCCCAMRYVAASSVLEEERSAFATGAPERSSCLQPQFARMWCEAFADGRLPSVPIRS
jgi:hypothetical protein